MSDPCDQGYDHLQIDADMRKRDLALEDVAIHFQHYTTCHWYHLSDETQKMLQEFCDSKATSIANKT